MIFETYLETSILSDDEYLHMRDYSPFRVDPPSNKKRRVVLMYYTSADVL